MLKSEDIQSALHASRVIPLGIANPHGPLGLEQVAAAVARIQADTPGNATLVSRPVSLPAATWEKLDEVARKAKNVREVTGTDVASALLQDIVAEKLAGS